MDRTCTYLRVYLGVIPMGIPRGRPRGISSGIPKGQTLGSILVHDQAVYLWANQVYGTYVGIHAVNLSMGMGTYG